MNKAQRTERIARAFELRKAGLSYRRIADQLGYSHEAVRQDINGMLNTITTETADNARELVALELARLDDMTVALWPEARHGDRKAIDSVLRIMERRAKLLGFDANPITKSVTVSVTPEQIASMSDSELQQLIQQLQ